VNLLKVGSKPVAHERKRRKIEIMSKPAIFVQMPEEQKQEERADAYMNPTYVVNAPPLQKNQNEAEEEQARVRVNS
jgi:hypothetical protein